MGRKGTSREIRAGLGLGFCLLVLLSGSAAYAAVPAVDSGSLEASVNNRPWSLDLTDRRGRSVLRERAGLGSDSAGTLGFRVDGQWRHATRVLRSSSKGRTWSARLATTDPDRDLSVELSPAGEGSIRLRARLIGPAGGVSAIGMAFRAPAKERYLGFGERSNAIDQTGRVVENWVGEGPYRPDEHALISNFVPKWGMRTTEDATYFPMPWLLSTSGYGVLLENTGPSYFRLRTDRPDTWSLELTNEVAGLDHSPAEPPPMSSISIRFFAGPKPAGALRRMTAATGRQPAPSPWFLGPWVQSEGGDESTIDRLRQSDVPTSVGQTYTHYLPCGGQLGRNEEQRERTSLFHGAGMAVTTYFNPMICTSYQPLYNELAAGGQLTRDETGNAYKYRYLRFEVGQFDFSSASARASYGDLLDEALDDGYDGWMEDFGEYTPPDGVSADGTPGIRMHNRYPRDYHCAAAAKTSSHGRQVLRFVRSGFTGTARCAPVVWGGDPSTSWDFDGLRSSIQNGLSMGLSGVGLWGSDIGGFFSIFSEPLSSEMMSRWVQFGAFSGVMRNEADGIQIDDRERPSILDPDQIGNWRRYASLRTQLYPYVSASTAEYRRTGMPVMRALVLEFPGDAQALVPEDQYMFGPDLMVAPVIEPEATSRKLYLPRGKWVDLWRSVGYEEDTRSFSIIGAEMVNGHQNKTVPAPIEEIPVLARAGTMLPMLPEGVDTLAPYGSKDTSIVRLADRSGRNLLAFPRGVSSARFGTYGKLFSSETERAWNLVIKDSRKRKWGIQASLASLRRPFPVRCVRVDGNPLPSESWSFQPEGKVLKATIRPRQRSASMTASAARC